MKFFLCAMMALFVPLAYGHLNKLSFPMFGACKEDLMSSVRTYWKTNGQPHNTLERLSNSSTATLIYSSYQHFGDVFKCIYFKFENTAFTGILVPKNGSSLNMTYILEQGEDEVIRGRLPPEVDDIKYRWNLYLIYLDEEIAVCYACGDAGEPEDYPVFDIFLVKNDKTILNSTKVKDFYNLLTGWGVQYKHNFGEECILNE